MIARSVAAGLALLVLWCPVAAAASPLSELLRRAGEYVRQFERDFAAVITDEVYEQGRFYLPAAESGSPVVQTRVHETRRIRSEMLFMRLTGQGLSWLTARNVLEVDGRPIADSSERLERAIKGGGSQLVERLRSVADEGARFNLGGVQRNFNDPNLALLFLDPNQQPRFSFKLGGNEAIDGVPARRVSFKEVGRPTIIKQTTGKSVFTTGAVWIRAEDGVVVRTEVSATTDTALEIQLRVEYAHDPKLDMWIPARMSEHYNHRSTNEEIDCLATYSNPRRFETSGRVIVK